MPTWTFIKRPGAPAGPINVTVNDDAPYLIDDGANLSIVTTDAQAAQDLRTVPFLAPDGQPDVDPVAPDIEPVFLADGTLSTRGPTGNIVTVTLPIDNSASVGNLVGGLVFGEGVSLLTAQQNAAAINTASLNLETAGGGTLRIGLLGDDTVMIGANVKLRTNVTLEATFNNVTLKRHASTTAMAVLTASYKDNIGINNLTIDGNKDNISPLLRSAGVTWNGGENARVNNFTVQNASSDGWILNDGVRHMQASNILMKNNGQVPNVGSTHGGHAIAFSGGGTGNLNWHNDFTNIQGIDNFDSTVNCSSTAFCTFTSANISRRLDLQPPGEHQPGYAGFRFSNGCFGNTVTSFTIRGHGRGIFMVSGSSFNKVSSGQIFDTMFQAVLINGSSNGIDDPLCRGNTVADVVAVNCCRISETTAFRVSMAPNTSFQNLSAVNGPGYIPFFGSAQVEGGDPDDVDSNALAGWLEWNVLEPKLTLDSRYGLTIVDHGATIDAILTRNIDGTVLEQHLGITNTNTALVAAFTGSTYVTPVLVGASRAVSPMLDRRGPLNYGVAVSDDVTSLVGSISASATVWNVDSSNNLLAKGNVRLPVLATVDSEVIQVQSISGTNQLTVARGQLGTTAASHSNGAVITGLISEGFQIGGACSFRDMYLLPVKILNQAASIDQNSMYATPALDGGSINGQQAIYQHRNDWTFRSGSAQLQNLVDLPNTATNVRGRVVRLHFAIGTTGGIKHAAGGVGQIMLSGATDWVPAAGDTILLQCDPDNAQLWRELSRSPLSTGSGLAPLSSPAFTGNPTAPTPGGGDNDTSIATTAFVQTAIGSKAPTASPTFTGDPKAPTPSVGDNDTSIATTAYVQTELNSKAPLASPTFTGDPKAPTPSAGDSDTSVATTAYVQTELGLLVPKYSRSEGLPGVWGMPRGILGSASVQMNAGQLILVRFVPSETVTIVAGAYGVNIINANDASVIIGLFDGSLNPLGDSTAITGNVQSTGRKIQTLSSSVTLTAGTVYHSGMLIPSTQTVSALRFWGYSTGLAVNNAVNLAGAATDPTFTVGRTPLLRYDGNSTWPTASFTPTTAPNAVPHIFWRTAAA